MSVQEVTGKEALVRFASSRVVALSALAIGIVFVGSALFLLDAARTFESQRSELNLVRQDLFEEQDALRLQQHQFDAERQRFKEAIASLRLEVEALESKKALIAPEAKVADASLAARREFVSGRFGEAARLFLDAAALSGNDADLIRRGAWSMYLAYVNNQSARDSLNQSIRLYRRVIRERSDDATAVLELALILTEQYNAAIEVEALLSTLVALDPAKAATFASAPQSRVLRRQIPDELRGWRECVEARAVSGHGVCVLQLSAVAFLTGEAPPPDEPAP